MTPLSLPQLNPNDFDVPTLATKCFVDLNVLEQKPAAAYLRTSASSSNTKWNFTLIVTSSKGAINAHHPSMLT